MVKTGRRVKTIQQRDVQGQAAEALRRALADVPGVRLQIEPRLPGGEGPDLLFRLQLPAGEQVLAVEVKRSGEPRAVREALDRIFRLRDRMPKAGFVIVAPYVSERGADLCARESVSYADLSGNCRLVLDPIFVRREGLPNAFAVKRDLRSLFSPKAVRVLRVLLADPNKPWRIQLLAGEAGVSVGEVANVKSALLAREWAAVGPGGLTLIEPRTALAEWAGSGRYARSKARDFYSLSSTRELEASLADACVAEGVTYALASFSAAARMAPQVRYQRATAYVGGDLDGVARSLGLKEVPTGANVRLLLPADEGVFYGSQEVDGVRIVSAVQCYVDLLAESGRGAEAAEALLKEVLSPRW
jgi:hypothetical protein